MPGMGGRFGTKLPPPAAITSTGAVRTLPVSVVSRQWPSGVLSSDAAISPKWNAGSNGLICSQQPVGQLLAGADRDAGNVVDRLLRIKLGALAARPVENVDQMGFQLGEAELKHGEQAHWARANNNDIGRRPRSPASLSPCLEDLH